MSKEYEIKRRIKQSLVDCLDGFVDSKEIQENIYEAMKGHNHDDVYEEVWNYERDDLINEMHDRLPYALEVIGYAYGIEIALALGYWSGYNGDNSLGIEINNGEQLGFVASYEYVVEKGLVYDVVDEYLKEESQTCLLYTSPSPRDS